MCAIHSPTCIRITNYRHFVFQLQNQMANITELSTTWVTVTIKLNTCDCESLQLSAGVKSWYHREQQVAMYGRLRDEVGRTVRLCLLQSWGVCVCKGIHSQRTVQGCRIRMWNLSPNS